MKCEESYRSTQWTVLQEQLSRKRCGPFGETSSMTCTAQTVHSCGTVCKYQPHMCYSWWYLQGLISTKWKWLGILEEKWLVIFTVWEKWYRHLYWATSAIERTRGSHWQWRRCCGYLQATILGFWILYCQKIPGWPLLHDCMWMMPFAIWKEGEDALVSDLMSYYYLHALSFTVAARQMETNCSFRWNCQISAALSPVSGKSSSYTALEWTALWGTLS